MFDAYSAVFSANQAAQANIVGDAAIAGTTLTLSQTLAVVAGIGAYMAILVIAADDDLRRGWVTAGYHKAKSLRSAAARSTRRMIEQPKRLLGKRDKGVSARLEFKR